MEFISGRGNLACTIFVPFDCSHNCPFCTSKKMYKNMTSNMDKIIEYIKMINKVDAVTEFVITGGEPTASLDGLKQIIDACEKKVFINTTLPLYEDNNYMVDVIEYINTENKIHGINVSRHLSFNFKGVVDIEFMKATIKKPIRINCVLRPIDKMNDKEIITFIDKYGNKNMLVNFRADYTKITLTNLKTRDEYDDFFLSMGKYLGTNCCMVCNSELFEVNGHMVCYHRGLEQSHLQYGNKIYVNDIIIYPNGVITYDWNQNLTYIEDFEKALFDNEIN